MCPQFHCEFSRCIILFLFDPISFLLYLEFLNGLSAVCMVLLGGGLFPISPSSPCCCSRFPKQFQLLQHFSPNIFLLRSSINFSDERNDSRSLYLLYFDICLMSFLLILNSFTQSDHISMNSFLEEWGKSLSMMVG